MSAHVDPVIVLQTGAEGGEVTLVGRRRVDGEWQFARITDDQTEAPAGDLEGERCA